VTFLKQMTFAQGMIIVCLLGSLALSPLLYGNYKAIGELTAAVAEGGELSKLVARIQSNSLLYSQLYEQKSGEALQGQGRTTEYLLAIAGDDNVDLGRINLPRPQVNESGGGIVDETFTIKPDDPTRAFDRVNIGNFLFTVENKTRRLRVTQFSMDALNATGKQKVRPEDLPSDKWTFSCRVTSRSRPASD
jgi:hypothetical protein